MASTTVGDVGVGYLCAQVAALQAADPLVRADLPDGVHRMRVAARRLRSVLATYRTAIDPVVTRPVRDELRWLGTSLGQARDAEVLRERLLAATAALPHDLVVGDVAPRLAGEFDRRWRVHYRAALADLGTDRYRSLRQRLDALCSDPPLLEAAGQDAAEGLPALLAHNLRLLRRARTAAFGAAPGREQDAALHALRKTAKRARYAAESMVPVLGVRAERAAARLTRLQDRLGGYQDVVVSRAVLVELGRDAELAGESAFTYGVIAGGDEERARALLAEAPSIARRAVRALRRAAEPE